LIGSGDTIVLYGNIDKFYKNVGDTIHKGDLIGIIKKETIDDRFELYFKIEIGRKDMLYDDQIKFLQRLH
jgi:septal ring factor EnvC (AmiA/AmiB activator)